MIEFGSVRGRDVRQSDRRPSTDTRTSACRDLVAISPVKPRENVQRHATRSSAAFLAHLIATAESLPQTREKRRLAPQEASRLYGATQARMQLARVRLSSP
jgi:hypothetical protein